jgi:polysaccharide export outer membrane protein/exopolysaccharide production protein ExoF
LKIFEWRASRDEIFGWEPLNDVYALGAEGDLSLPLIGHVRAGGLSGHELSSLIAAQLEEQMGLGRRPVVAVEIVEYRPFYIVGPVGKPGSYPFRSGLTVLKAVSIAGGMRTETDQLFGTQRSIIAAAGELRLLQLQRDSLLARSERLNAELAGLDEVKFAAELVERKNAPAVAALLLQERQIFDARKEAYETQMLALAKLKDSLETELPSLAAQLGTVETQVRLTREELEAITTLRKSGLVNEPRRMGLERAVAQIEGERLRVEQRLLNAKQEISRAEISIVELRSRRAQEVALEIRETQAKIEEAARKIATTTELIESAQASLPYVMASSPLGGAEATYHILRQVDGRVVEMSAEESTPVEPGDTVKVNIKFPVDPPVEQPRPQSNGHM